MPKFTIFTVILTIIVIVVAAEIFVSDYLPQFARTKDGNLTMEMKLPENFLGESMEANVLGNTLDNKLGADVDYSSENLLLDGTSDNGEGAVLSIPESLDSTGSNDAFDFESANYSGLSTNVYLREEQIKSAGFVNAFIEQEQSDGYLYKTISIDDLYDTELKKYVIRTKDSLLAKVYIFTFGPNTTASEVFQVLKLRATEGLDIEVNSTNEYGDSSFYMNDNRRSGVAFLTVRIGEMIYGFSYPKEYHSQMKNLISLLDLEF